MRTNVRPNGAFKLLVHLMYGNYPFLARIPRGITGLQSVRKMARLLGTDSKKVNNWLRYLEDQGYIESLSYSQNRREARFRIREPNL